MGAVLDLQNSICYRLMRRVKLVMPKQCLSEKPNFTSFRDVTIKDYSQRAFVNLLSHSAGQGVDCYSDDIALILGHKCFTCYKLYFCIHVLSMSTIVCFSLAL